ncbi:hypothetical protein EON71_00095 [bacterium]|nr:MAG: hypothetical protein EON71_00095 [bacterium]
MYNRHIVNQPTIYPGIYSNQNISGPVTQNRTGACETVYNIDPNANKIYGDQSEVLYRNYTQENIDRHVYFGEVIALSRDKSVDTSLPPYAQTNLVGMGHIDENVPESVRLNIAKQVLQSKLVFGGFSVSNNIIPNDPTTFNGALSGNITLKVNDTDKFTPGTIVTAQLPDPPTSQYHQQRITMKLEPYEHKNTINNMLNLCDAYLASTEKYEILCDKEDNLKYTENFIRKLNDSSTMDGLLLLDLLLKSGIVTFNANNDIKLLPQIKGSNAITSLKVHQCFKVDSIENFVLSLAQNMDLLPGYKNTTLSATASDYFKDFARVFKGSCMYSGTYQNYEFGNQNPGFLTRHATTAEIYQTANGAFVSAQINNKRNQMAAWSALVQKEREWIVGKVMSVGDQSIELYISNNGY